MRKQRPESLDPIQSMPSSGPEIDYSPKVYTWSQAFLYGATLFAIAAGFLLLFWLVERI